ncbi:MAG: bifunctional nicotinamidase/pyrazinamidase [Spirochaetes bacterium]|nr:bifunctional nicotinamidase/pyrazinamidase [Spirochaetota bacterium]
MPVETAFLAVDIQNDFCPGGALAVSGGDLVVPVVNRVAGFFRSAVLTQDWHPRGHVSFASSHPGAEPYSHMDAGGIGQTLWPDHCVAGTRGSDFHPGLDTAPYRLVIRKGTAPGLDSYSAFFENDGSTVTGLDGWLRAMGVAELWIAGIATDYCVFFTAADAVRLGYRVAVLEDAVRAVDVPAGNRDRAVAAMRAASIRFALSEEVA